MNGAGTWALTEGDSDEEMRWGGTDADAGELPSLVVPIAPDEDGRTVNTLTLPAPVAALQDQLNQLGFWFVRRARAGAMERYTRWAVREFQIYAKMPRVARQTRPLASGGRYVDCLEPAANGAPYTGPVSGVANAATQRAIQYWLANRLRCPVVVEAWTVQRGQRTALQGQNLWLHDEFTSSAPRMYVRDFSGYYGPDPGDLVVLGDWVTYQTWNGPRSVPPNTTRAEGEITPERLIGAPLARLTPAQRSTFKVIRAVLEVECYGFFDSVNAYDNAFVSLGPCHWTLGIVGEDEVANGELAGFLAYLRQYAPPAAERALEFFGVRADRDWGTGAQATGRALFDRSSRKYLGWVSVQREDGGYARLTQTEAEGDYFKTWHWFYRWVMAGRTVPGFQRSMWPMARIRLRDIRSTPLGVGPTNATIGSVFSSERAMALLLRWHIRLPGFVIHRGRATTRIRDAFTRAAAAAPRLNWGAPASAWTHAHEAALLRGLRAEIAEVTIGDLTRTIPQVERWPAWAGGNNPRGYMLDRGIGTLSEARNSLIFDSAGLPTAPY